MHFDQKYHAIRPLIQPPFVILKTRKKLLLVCEKGVLFYEHLVYEIRKYRTSFMNSP